MSILIKDMDMPDKCWDCELFDELSIHFTGITAPNTDIGWCRGCKKEILDVDYKEDKPLWCPLVEIPAQQWIPCSERLPNKGEEVLATMYYGDITMAEYLGGDDWFAQEGNANSCTEEILAWIPLPEPWKGEEDVI